MKIVNSNIPPLRAGNMDQTFIPSVKKELEQADTVCFATGYASKKAIIEIDELVHEYDIRSITLILGMYCIEGFPEGLYNTALRIHNKWKEEGIGEIRAVKSMKYHGKLYGFYHQQAMISCIIGSHNLGALAVDANNRRQYEISMLIDTPAECSELSEHLRSLSNEPISSEIDALTNVVIIHEDNTKMNGIVGVSKVSAAEVDNFCTSKTALSFDIPLKVPGMPNSTNDFMKSNINKCYAKGRLNSRSGVVTERGWWETEVIVSNSITAQNGYPDRDVPFFVITDDGWKFKMHVSGDHKKNLESDGDLKILGYWLKGRLVAAGIVEPVDSPAEDLKNKTSGTGDNYANCKGVITYQKLLQYGRPFLTLTKTMNKMTDEDGIYRDVWILSFLPDRVS